MAALQELINDEELATLLSMFLLANAKKNLSLSSFHAFPFLNHLMLLRI